MKWNHLSVTSALSSFVSTTTTTSRFLLSSSLTSGVFWRGCRPSFWETAAATAGAETTAPVRIVGHGDSGCGRGIISDSRSSTFVGSFSVPHQLHLPQASRTSSSFQNRVRSGGGFGGISSNGATGRRSCRHYYSSNMNKNDDDDAGQQELDELPPLVFIGDRELMSPCEPFDLETLRSQDTQSKLQMLRDCQKAYGGIGIAACQVGWRARIFCMGFDDDDSAGRARERYPDAPPFRHQFWINPTIEPVQQHGTSWFWEGCLSVPGMRGWVERPNVVRIKGYDENGKALDDVELDGLPARVAQHEYDHLDGILFPSKTLQGTLLPVAAFEEGRQDLWPKNWPTVGSRRTRPGGFSDVK